MQVAICAAGELWGGVEECVITLVEHLHVRGLRPVVILFHDAQLASRLRQLGIEPEIVTGRSAWDLALVTGVRRVLEQRRIDVVHVHGYKASIVAALAALGRPGSRVKVVKTEHGALERPAEWRALGGYMKLAMNTAIDRLVSALCVDRVVYVSRAMAAGRSPLQRSGAVIYNGVEVASIRSEAAGPRRTRPFTVGIVGRLTAVKGHTYLLDALAQLPDGIEACIVGVGPDEPALKARCAELGLAPRVHFAGFVYPVYPELASFDVLVMPSLHEGLPYTLLEAMALGVPVVASAVGGVPEVIEDGLSGVLVPPRDAGALAAAIRGVHDDPARRYALGQAARLRIERAFHADAMVSAYVEEYRACAA